MALVSIIGPTATNVIVKLDRIKSLTSDYKFSNEFTFSNMIWKVAVKESRGLMSFLIYSTNKTLHRNRGFKIMIKMPATREENDFMIEARRHFGNKSTCFMWNCSRKHLMDHCVSGETLVLDVAIQIMADDRILSNITSVVNSVNGGGGNDSMMNIDNGSNDSTMADMMIDGDDCGAMPLFKSKGRLVNVTNRSIDWRADGLDALSQDGRYSPESLIGGAVWEVSISRSGTIYAVKINCNREAGSAAAAAALASSLPSSGNRSTNGAGGGTNQIINSNNNGQQSFVVCARIQIIIKSVIEAADANAVGSGDANGTTNGTNGSSTPRGGNNHYVEGARVFVHPEDCLTWSFDKSITSLIQDQSLLITANVTVYHFDPHIMSSSSLNHYINNNITNHNNHHHHQLNGNANGSTDGVVEDVLLNGSSISTPPPATATFASTSTSSSQSTTTSSISSSSNNSNMNTLMSPFPADITFKVNQDTEVIHAHRGVVMARSCTLADQLNVEDPPKEIRIPDMKKSALMPLIRYMYTNEIICDDDDILLSIKAAERLGMIDYVTKCRPTITTSNVLKLLDIRKNNLIQRDCWDVIDSSFETIAASVEFLKLPIETIAKILQRDQLMCSEINIYNTIMKWCKSQLSDAGKAVDDVDAQKELVKDLLPFIRFPIMSAADFSSGPVVHGLLESADVIACFMYQTSKMVKPELRFSIEQRRWGIGHDN